MPAFSLENSVPGHKGANIVVGAASAGAVLPSPVQFLAMCTAGNCHFRTGVGVQTAVATDPLLSVNAGWVIVRVPANHDHIAVIQDGSSTGNFNFFPVYPC